jgi:hypothetical protein
MEHVARNQSSFFLRILTLSGNVPDRPVEGGNRRWKMKKRGGRKNTKDIARG